MFVPKVLDQFNIVQTVPGGDSKLYIDAECEKLFYHVKTNMEVVYFLPTGMSHRCQQEILESMVSYISN